MSASLPVTGARAQSGMQPRLEIRQLQSEHPEQFTLFILGFHEIMKKDFKPLAGQFEQIAGIHGMPYVPWPGDLDGAKKANESASWNGYCNHASILFPNWHRPYLMLIEQVISDCAHSIAQAYSSDPGVSPEQGQKWVKAASDLRLPFWDWTDDETSKNGIPDVFRNPSVDLLERAGNKKYYKHDNVLAYYKFHKLEGPPIAGFKNRPELTGEIQGQGFPQATAYFADWNRTYRRPNSSPHEVEENYSAMNRNLTNPNDKARGSCANLRKDIAMTFNFPIDIPKQLWANVWDEYSNTSFQSGRPEKSSGILQSPYHWRAATIEQPHNNVHLLVGGLGHMGENDTAGFDPIFFLHHCNVDRMLAFWEHIYPDYVVGTEGFLDVDGKTRVPFTQSGGTFVETAGQEVTSNTPLLPFRKSDNTYWTSSDTHGLKLYDPEQDSGNASRNKYYTYLPIAGVDINPKTPPSRQERDLQRGRLQEHFGFNPSKNLGATGIRIPTVDPHGDRLPAFGAGISDNALFTSAAENVIKDYREFAVVASLSQTLYNGSYSLDITMKAPEGQSVVVGTVSVLGRGEIANCENCQARRAANTRVAGFVYIDHEVIAQVLSAGTVIVAQTNDSSDQIINALRSSLNAEVVLPSGRVLSYIADDAEPDDQRVPDEMLPTVRLVSSEICQPTYCSEAEGPFNFHQWVDHGAPYGNWVYNKS
ncbi:hypothetical protein FRC07_012369 [Ceratobasidium sp. 392]|nr:hypothetical protein FRC07_012369 [Ceratobasidium sp. 392]